MAELLTPDNLIALVTLTLMEVVLGIDNIIFIAILCGRLPEEKREKIRKIGIGLALVARIGLLFSIAWVMRLTEPLFEVWGHSFSGRDLILLGGGLFLIAKATVEIHHKVEGDDEDGSEDAGKASVRSVLFQIIMLDIIFSLDSVITAVGMVKHVPIMLIAMIISVIVMLVLSSSISRFVEKHPTVKILALAFLILIGVMLTVEGMGKHVEKGYIYFAMFFSIGIELLNMRYRLRRGAPKIKAK